MMRKIFGGAMVLSIVGAVVLGGILAFQSQQTTNEFQATVGDAQWVLAYESEPNTIVPGYGNEIVGEGYIANDPGSSFSIVNTGGFVTISEVTSGCPSSLFTSAVNVVQTAPVNPGNGFLPTATSGAAKLNPPPLISTDDEVGTGTPEQSDATWSTYPGAFQALIGLPSSVPGTCFGATVGYHVTINVTPQPVGTTAP